MRYGTILWAILIVSTSNLQSQNLGHLDEIAPFSEGLAGVRKGNEWGFIDEEGTLVIDFRADVHWNKEADTSKSDVSGVRYPMFHEGRCLIREIVEDGVAVYGFIDMEGNVVIEPKFLNVYPFEDGYTTGVLFEKTFRGNNEFNLRIYDFQFFDVLLEKSGEIVAYYNQRHNIQMTKRRYQLPWIGAKKLADGLVAVHEKDKGWEIRRLAVTN